MMIARHSAGTFTGFFVRQFDEAVEDGAFVRLRRPEHEDAGSSQRASAVRYCSHCGSQAIQCSASAGESFLREHCADCGFVHYRNPRIVVGCLASYRGSVLLSRRAAGPRRGSWTIPAGYLEEGETAAQGAARELHEEVTATVSSVRLRALLEMPQINQVFLMYQGELAVPSLRPGPESLDARLFAPDEVPWDELAFPTDREVLIHHGSAIARELLTGSFHWDTDGAIQFTSAS